MLLPNDEQGPPSHPSDEPVAGVGESVGVRSILSQCDFSLVPLAQYACRSEVIVNSDDLVRILGISGSLRRASFSTAILKNLAHRVAPSMRIDVMTLKDIPFYSEDLDQVPGPLAVAKLKRKVAESDGVLFSTPEYNHGIPGVLNERVGLGISSRFQVLLQEQTGFNHQFFARHHRRGPRAAAVARDPDFHARPSHHGPRGRDRRHSHEVRKR